MSIKDISLSSHSNANVSLLLEDGRLCVVKQSDRADGRFIQCIAKQKNFEPIALSGLSISAARVLRETMQDGKSQVVMNYVHGVTGEDFALQGNREIAGEISRGLSALLIDSMSRSKVTELSCAVFLEKMDQVLAATRIPELQPIIAKARQRLLTLIAGRSTLAMPVGRCHGDLTLSNVILSQSQGMVLIDFLATYLDSPLQDLAKISQDLEFGWSFRRLDQNLQIKAKVFSRLAFPSYADHLYMLFPLPAYVFKLLCLARIAPYVNDNVTTAWLNSAIIRVIEASPSDNLGR